MTNRIWVVVKSIGRESMEVMGAYTTLEGAMAVVKDDDTAAVGFLPNRLYCGQEGFLLATKTRPEPAPIEDFLAAGEPRASDLLT